MSEIKRVKIDSIIESQIPDFINEEYPLFVEFLKSYYLSLEIQSGTLDLANNINKYKTISQFNNESLTPSTTLTSEVLSFDSTINVESTKSWPERYGLLKIGDEIITYKSKTATSFVDCYRGFSGIDAIQADNNSQFLNFSTTSAAEHQTDSIVTNLSNLFLIEFFDKFKYEFLPGFEGRDFNENISIENVVQGIRTFYASKGTDSSYKLLFKILYGKDIEIIKPQDFTLIPSSNVYFTTKNILVEKISGGRAVDTKGNFLYQDIAGIGTASASIYNVEYRPINQKEFYEISLDSTSFNNNFQASGKTKILETVPVGSDTILVDSTVGFSKSGTIIIQPENSNFIQIQYTDKTINQFLGVTGVTKELNFGLDIKEEKFAYSYIGVGNTSKVEFRIVNIIDEIDISKTSNLVVGDRIQLSGFGKDLSIKNEFSSWIYNIPTKHNISKINAISSNQYRILLFDFVYFDLNENLYVEDSNGNRSSANIININFDTDNKLSNEIQIQILDAGFDLVNAKKIVKKIYKANHYLENSEYLSELNSIPSGVQNTYTDSAEEYFYVTSTGLPNYTIFSTNNQQNISAIGSTNIFLCENHPYTTGELVYYYPLPSDTSGISTGLYYASNLDLNHISLSYSKSDIFSKKYLEVVNSQTSIGISSALIIKNGYQNKILKNQKLLKKFNFNKKYSSFDDINLRSTNNKELGLLINGVELLAPSVFDENIFYGQLEEIEVTDNGVDYDIINTPTIDIIDTNGSGAKAFPNIVGEVREIRVISPGVGYKEKPKITISGGNGSGCVLESNLVSSRVSNTFSAELNVNPLDDTIQFLDRIVFSDFEEVIYNTNGNANINGLIDGSHYFIGIQNPDTNTVQIYENLSDSILKINAINLVGISSGTHYFESLKNKNTITKVYVKESGSGYSNRSIKIPSVLSFDNNTVGINTFDSYLFAKKHGFMSGDLVQYSTTDTVISGLSTESNYYVSVVDVNKFKLSLAGVGTNISNQDYLNKKYISFSNTGVGTHTISYPPITIQVESISIGSTTVIEPVFEPIVLGNISDVYLENGGSGYGTAEIINFHRRPDVGITSVRSEVVLKPIVLNGSIVDVKIVSSGRGYRKDSDIIIGGSGNFAEIVPIISDDGRLSALNIINSGVGYASSNTTVTLVNRGTKAKFLASVRKWSINQVTKSENIISSEDDGVLYPNKNPNLGLQFIHFYIPKKLRYKTLDNFTNTNIEDTSGTPKHSPILGFAYDGNPIYGPYGYSNPNGFGGIRRMNSSYISNREINTLLRPESKPTGYFVDDYIYDASGDLDEHNGRFCITPEYPNGTYAYFYTISVNSNNISSPAYPYVVGKYFKDIPIVDNFLPKFNQDLNIFSNGLTRNVSSYYLNSTNSSYELIDKVSADFKQEFRVSEIKDSSLEGSFIFSPGENYKVDDRIILNREGTDGSPANIVVSEIYGTEITEYSGINSRIDDVNFIIKNSTVITKTSSPHSLLDEQPVSITGVSTITSSDLQGIKYIVVKNREVELANDVDIVSSTGISTFINVKNVVGFEVNDFIGIGSETLLITGISKENSRFYVNRISNTSSHEIGVDNVVLLPTKFEFATNETKDFTFENTVTFFDPKVTVGTGTAGVSRSIIGIGTSSTEVRFIPSRSIYLPGHKFFTGESLIYDCGVGGTSLVVNNVGSASSFKLERGQTVYAVNLGKNYVGLSTLGFTTSTGIGTQLNSLEFWDLNQAFGVVGYAHSLLTTNAKITGTVTQSVGIFTTKSNHGLLTGDSINLKVIANNIKEIKLIYDSVNRKVLANPVSFGSTQVSTTYSEINISEYDYEIKTGDKVVYISSNIIGGLTNYGIYYVLKTNNDSIQLCNYESDIKNSNYINFSSEGGGNQQLYFVNPPIKVLNGSVLKFDLSDSSLLDMELEFFYDINFSEKIGILGTVEDGFAIIKNNVLSGNSGSYISIDFSNSYVPSSFYYNLLTKGLVGTDKNQISSDISVIGSNNIISKNHSLNDRYVITSLGENLFSIDNNKILSYDETYNLSQSNFTYYTQSKNASGPIKSIKINYKGKGYKKVPYVDTIETVNGKSALIKIISNVIGKVKELERIKDGFDYPTDPTLSPKLTTPAVIGIKDIRTIDYVGIISGGRGYNTNPSLVVKENPEIKLSCSIFGSSVTEVNILKNVTNLSSPLEIIPIRNSNGYEIFAIEVNSNLVTLELVNDQFITSGFGITTFTYPFSIGDEIFIENCRISSASIISNPDAVNFNSSDYDYAYFPIVDVNVYNNTITYDISDVSIGTFGEYDTTFNYGTVVNKKDLAQFEMFLSDNVNYLSKEKVFSTNQKFSATVMENGWDNNLNLLRVNNCVGILTSGDKLVGEDSKITGTIEFFDIFNLNATLGVSRDKLGLLDKSVGILNDFQQRLSDNFYYQKFAYSVKGEIPYDTWRESVKSIIHPSGFKEFSDLVIYSDPSQNKVGSGKSTNMKVNLSANDSSTLVNIDSESSMYSRNNFANVYEDELLPDGSIETVYISNGTPLQSYILNKTNKVLLIDDITEQFSGSSDSNLEGRYLDASNLIELNKEFIQEEVVAFVEYNYPTIGLSTTYSDVTCKRDVGYIVDALAHDIKYNSNNKSVEAGLSYWNAGLSYVVNENEETLFAYNYVRFLAQYIINNQTPPTLYQTSIDQQFNLNLIQDPTNKDLYRYKDARDLIVANRSEILDKSLASVAVGFSTFYFPGDVQTNSRSRYYDAYRLIQQNKTEIIDTSWSNTVGVYTGISTTQTKCKRDIGYFIDAVSTDIFTGGNSYSREFVLQYFNNGNPISNGLVGEETESIYAFDQAKNLMKLAITNNLTIQDLAISVGPSTYAGGGGNIPNTNTSACTDVQNTISTLVGIVTAVIGAGSTIGLPSVNVGTYTTGGNKCYRDLGYIVDAIAEDVAFGSNQHIIYATKKYFTGAGVALTSGLVGEELQSVYAFKSARDYINQALTNQLNVKDLTIVPDPITGFNTSPLSCSNVQTNVSNLVGILTTAILTASLSAIPTESYGTTDCADVRTAIGNYVGIITTIIGLGTSYAPTITYPSLSLGGIVVGLSTFKLTNKGTSLFKHTFDASSTTVDIIDDKFIIPNHNYQTGQELIYDYGNGTPIGIGSTSYVTGITSTLIKVTDYNGTAIYENGYNVAISTTITGISTILSPVGPAFKIYNSVKGTNGVGIATFNILISYSGVTGQPLSTSVILVDGGTDFAIGDTVSIAGTYIGGSTPTNNLSFKISSTSPTRIPSQSNVTYSNIPSVDSNGAVFNVSRDDNGYVSLVSVVSGGSGYSSTSVISIGGTYIGGTVPTDTIEFSPLELGSAILPRSVFVYKLNDNEFKLSGLSTSLFLNLTGLGTGYHSLEYTNPNPSVLISIDGIIQSPLTKKSLDISLGSPVSTASTTIVDIASGISSLTSNDIININNEYMLIKTIGLTSTTEIEVDRGFLGTVSGVHTVGSSCTVLNGNYNIIGDVIYFTTPPYGNKGPVGLETSSSFVGRIFSRQFDASQTIDDNIILDDISLSFTGVASTEFLLLSNGSTTQTLYNNINYDTNINNNPLILINNVLQVPEKDYIIDGPTENTIKFISGVPRAGKISKFGINSGFGYQPLIGAAATVTVSAAGTISNVILTGSGFGYRQPPSISIASTIGFGASITASVGTGGTITGFTIVNSGFGYTNTSLPTVRIGIPTSYSNLGVVYSAGSSGVGQGAKVSVVVGQGSSIINFSIDDPGIGYKRGDILSVVGIITNSTIGPGFSTFTITVEDTENDKFSGFYPGQCIIFENISDSFNGAKRKFNLKVNVDGEIQTLTLKTPIGSDLDISNNFIVFVNEILQVPNVSYTIQGSRIVFDEAPKSGSNCTIFYYRGSSIDVELIDPPKVLKEGDIVKILENKNDPLDASQFGRVIKNISSSDTFNTFPYSNIGINTDNTKIRPLSFTKQSKDIVINGVLYSKQRPDLKSTIKPISTLIKPVTITDTKIYVDNAFPIFGDVDGLSENLAEVLITEDREISSAYGIGLVSVASTIYDATISDPGVGYAYTDSPKIVFSKSYIQKKDPIYNWSYSVGTPNSYQINSVSYQNLFVAVGNSSILSTSLDGETWNSSSIVGYSTDLSNLDFTSVTSVGLGNSSLFIAVGSLATVITSVGYASTISSWSKISLLEDSSIPGLGVISRNPTSYTGTLNDIAYSSSYDTFVTVGTGGSIFSGTGISTDVYINRFSETLSDLNSVAFSSNEVGGYFLVVGENGTVISSNTGLIWETDEKFTTVGLNKVIYADGKFVIVGNNGEVAISSFKSSYLSIPTDVSVDFVNIDYNDGVYVAITSTGDLYYSLNLVNWIYRDTNQINTIKDIISVPSLGYDGTYVLVGYGGTSIFSTPTYHQATGQAFVSAGIVTSVIITDGGFGYDANSSPPFIVEQDIFKKEKLVSIKSKGDFGTIIGINTFLAGTPGIGTTTPKIEFILKSDSYDNGLGIGYSSLNTFGVLYPQLEVGDYFTIRDSNVTTGHDLIGITTAFGGMSNYPNSKVGTAISFINGVYRVESVTSPNVALGIVTVTCNFAPKSPSDNYVQVYVRGENETGIGTNGFYGRYSWGAIYDYQNRVLGFPQSFDVYNDGGLVGISSSPKVIRTRGLLSN